MRTLGLRALIILFTTVGFGASALAQSDAVVVSGSELGAMTQGQIETQIAELRNEYADIDLSGPRAGLGISAILIPAGAISVGLGAAVRSLEKGFLCPSSDPKCGDPTAGSAAAVILGALALVGGVVGVAISSRRLKQRKNERRRVELEILGFQNSLRTP